MLNHARDRFAAHGINAVGVAEIAKAAETTKMTLYSVYASKDSLIAAVMRDAGARWQAAVDRAAETSDGVALEQFAVLFAELAADPLSNPMVLVARGLLELPLYSEGSNAAYEVLGNVQDFVQATAEAAGTSRPDLVTYRCMSLLMGSSVLASRSGDELGGTLLRQAAGAARLLLLGDAQAPS